jgi:hypothetical protein
VRGDDDHVGFLVVGDLDDAVCGLIGDLEAGLVLQPGCLGLGACLIEDLLAAGAHFLVVLVGGEVVVGHQVAGVEGRCIRRTDGGDDHGSLQGSGQVDTSIDGPFGQRGTIRGDENAVVHETGLLSRGRPRHGLPGPVGSCFKDRPERDIGGRLTPQEVQPVASG